jgi:hypothetical protein
MNYMILHIKKKKKKSLRERTLETLESGFALRADLVSFSALILVASSADGKGTLVAGHEQLSVHG